MAAEQEGAVTLPDPKLVGDAFVEQYYPILHRTPDQVYRFYQDSSSISRPGPDGAMTLVTTMQGINEKIISFGYENYQAAILTIDSQSSYQNGVMVVVTGSLTGIDKIKRKFTQSFFLAPQNKGFFVLNDIFKFLDGPGSTVIAKYDNESKTVADNSAEEVLTETPAPAPAPDAETIQVIDHSVENHVEKIHYNVEKANHQLENGETTPIEKEVVEAVDPPCNSTHNVVRAVVEETSLVKQDAQKKSYASMVNALKENPAPFQVKISSKPSVRQAATPKAPAPAPAPSNNSKNNKNSSFKRNNDDHSEKGHSIFIRNLPCDATAEQLEAIFKKFGSIKRNGIQVRGFKDQQSCFGFVEFDSLSSMESAIQASPVTIGDRNATVEMKRRDNNDGGRFRGGFRNDNSRPRGNFGGRRYGSNEREEFSGRARGNNGHNYPQERGVSQNGGAAPQTAKA